MDSLFPDIPRHLHVTLSAIFRAVYLPIMATISQKPFDVLSVTARDLQQFLQADEITSVQIVDEYRKQI